MNVTIISCYFATSYGAYTAGLRGGLERRLGREVRVVTSNCGCGDPVQVRGEFQDRQCVFFAFPNVPYWKSARPWRHRLRIAVRDVVYRVRAGRYRAHSRGSDVVHFQQTLNAFGSAAVFNWLRRPSRAARVVTIHELDPYQLDVPGSNLNYNLADRILVHTGPMRDRLVELGVDGSLIELVHHGVDIGPLPSGPRSGIVFYGGHFPATNKGLATLLAALRIVRERLGPATPRLTIHGHNGVRTPAAGLRLAADNGVSEHVRWLNQVPLATATEVYRTAQLCVLPYVGSFAGFAASLALANGVPVIATRHAGLPEHLGPLGVWIEDDDAAGLAAAVIRLLGDEAERTRLARAGRERAEQLLGWDAVAARTTAAYETALARAVER